MKYQIKRFSDGDSRSENYKSKEDAGAEWLNEIAKQGYRCVSVAVSPMFHKKELGDLELITSQLIVVVEKSS